MSFCFSGLYDEVEAGCYLKLYNSFRWGYRVSWIIDSYSCSFVDKFDVFFVWFLILRNIFGSMLFY